MPHVLMICGSLRKKSFNRQLMDEIRGMIGDRAEIHELTWDDVPFMNQDAEWPTPAPVQRARDAVAAADGIWICSPEYNYNIPGGLKNLLDWLSRPTDQNDYTSPSILRGKRATISGVGGRAATAGMRNNMEKLFAAMGVEAIGKTGVGISVDPSAWTTDILELTDEQRAQLADQVETFLAAIAE